MLDTFGTDFIEGSASDSALCLTSIFLPCVEVQNFIFVYSNSSVHPPNIPQLAKLVYVIWKNYTVAVCEQWHNIPVIQNRYITLFRWV